AQHLGQTGVRAAVVGDLHRVDRRERVLEECGALGVGGQEQVEPAFTDDGRGAEWVGIVRRRPRGPRRWAEDADRQAADADHLALARLEPADASPAGLLE